MLFRSGKVKEAGFAVSHVSSQDGVRKGEIKRINWRVGKASKRGSGSSPLGLARKMTALQLDIQKIIDSTKPMKSYWKSICNAANNQFTECTVRVEKPGTLSATALDNVQAAGFLVCHVSTQLNVKMGEIKRITWGPTTAAA